MEHAVKVCVVTPWYPTVDSPFSGLFVQREVDAFAAVGRPVYVVHLDRSLPAGKTVPAVVGGRPVLRLGMNPANPVSVALAVPALRRALSGMDVVNSHAISALPVVALARGRAKWVHTEHWSALSNPESAPALLRAVRPAFASLLRLPDAVVAESERLAEPIRAFGGSPVELIPCIVPAPPQLPVTKKGELADPNSKQATMRTPATRVRDPIRLASTGGVIDRKDPLLAVRTVKELEDRGVAASLIWTGEGDLRGEAIELAAKLGVDAEFPGAGSEEEVQERTAAADVFFAPTKGENFFVAAAEALVSGRPLVASDQGGHTEYADPKFTEIVTERTPGAYADAVLAVLRKTSGVPAEEIAGSVRDRFSPSTVAGQYLSLYSRLRDGQ